MSPTSTAVSPELAREVRARYGVGPRYAEAYLKYWQEVRDTPVGSLAQILAGPDPEPMWFEFALSTNVRARGFFEAYQAQFPPGGGRYLDVGCGFGGYLVAFAERGYEAVGIEIDPQRVGFSRANCGDAGLEDCVHEGSILDDELVARLGHFDVVTCIDVIEHVLDVPKTLHALAGLLRPGGVLLLEIPNKDSVAFVRSDGHFELFGITQLPRELAIEYHKRFFEFDYDVGDYHTLDVYLDALTAEGLQCHATPTPFHPPRRFAKELPRLALEWFRFRGGKGRQLPRDLRRELDRRARRFGLSASWNALAGSLRLRDRAAIQSRFLCDFWTLVARAPRG